MVSPRLAVMLVLMTAPPLLAQNLRTIDSIPYGPTPIPLDGQDAGAVWDGGWLGVGAQHPIGLSSYWEFEDNVLDSGPMQSNGVANGPTYSTDVPAPISAWSTRSLALVGANQDYVDLDQHVGKYEDLNHGSIAVWIKSSAGSALTVIGASDSSDPSHEIALSLSNGRPWFDVRGDLNSWQQVFTSATINDGTWHHLCVVCDGNGVTTLYVDGLPVDTRHQGFFRYVFDLDTMSIGRNVDSGGSQWHFDGLLDDLAVWSSPLTASDVMMLAQGTLPPLAIVGTLVPVGPVVEASSLFNTGFLSNGLVMQGNKIVNQSIARGGRSFVDHWNLAQNATYYLSCLLRREDTNASIEPALIELTDAGTTRGLFGWDALGNWVVGGIGQAVGAEMMQPNTDYFCILRIDASSGAGDVAYLKIYGPGSVVPADDSGIATVGTGANQWTAMSSPYASGAVMSTVWLTPTGANKIELDELRMGSTWESVVRLTYGAGCLGAQMSASGRPVIGSSTTLLLAGGASNSLAGLLMGLSSTASALGPLPLDLGALGGPAGCLLLQSNEASVAVVADAQGSASFVFGIPANPGLYGVNILSQWASLDTSLAAVLPVRMSDALHIMIEN